MADHLRPVVAGTNPIRVNLNPDGRSRQQHQQEGQQDSQQQRQQKRAPAPVSEETERKERSSFERLLRGEH